MGGNKGFLRYDRITIGMIIAFLALVVGSTFLIPLLGAPGMFLFILIAISGLSTLVWWHASHYAYACTACGEKFTVGFWQEFISPHTLRTKWLRCPHCGKRVWAREVERDQ